MGRRRPFYRAFKLNFDDWLPLFAGHHHVNLPAASLGASSVAHAIDDRRRGTVSLGLPGRIGLDLMAAIPAPYDQADAGRSRAA